MNAIYIGGLAGKPKFFGGIAAETISVASLEGGWNRDRKLTPTSRSWHVSSGSSDWGDTAGAFALSDYTGAVYGIIGHRTILSGY